MILSLGETIGFTYTLNSEGRDFFSISKSYLSTDKGLLDRNWEKVMNQSHKNNSKLTINFLGANPNSR